MFLVVVVQLTVLLIPDSIKTAPNFTFNTCYPHLLKPFTRFSDINIHNIETKNNFYTFLVYNKMKIFLKKILK